MTYHVRTRKTGNNLINNTVTSFVVTDQPDNYPQTNWDGYPRPWPLAAEFHVSLRYDEETQKRRAFEYCDYLNKGIVVQPPIGE
jgi:hypothetical protein